MAQFDSYVVEYKGSPWASYYSVEDFLANLEEIQSHDSLQAGFSKGVNQFTGLRWKEEKIPGLGGKTVT